MHGLFAQASSEERRGCETGKDGSQKPATTHSAIIKSSPLRFPFLGGYDVGCPSWGAVVAGMSFQA